jgi:hypothetical protein
MRFASTRPQFNQFASRQTPDTLLDERMQRDLFQRWPSLDCPLVPLWIDVFGIDISFGMNYPSVDTLKAVRFLADKPEVVNSDMPSLQKTDCAFFAGTPERIGAL